MVAVQQLEIDPTARDHVNYLLRGRVLSLPRAEPQRSAAAPGAEGRASERAREPAGALRWLKAPGAGERGARRSSR